ncbi:MAG: response regulator [Deltaproteobacteria bacterium]|nr:response regulator [Deltaproteobacteria bacterium]
MSKQDHIRLRKVISRLFATGISTANSDYTNSKIKLCNQIALFLFFLGLIYGGFSLIYFPVLAALPGGASVVATAAILLNKYGKHQISRFLLPTGAVSLDSLYHAFLVPAGEPMIDPLFMAAFSFSLYSWVLVDIREKALLISSIGVCFFWLFGQNWLNPLLEYSGDTGIFRSVPILVVSYGFAGLIAVTCLYFLQKRNLVMETERNGLLKQLSKDYQSEHHSRLESEKRQLELEVQLMHSQRIEAIGRLAGGIAHDLNNMLTPVLGYGDLLVEDLPKNSGAQQQALHIVEAATRARDLVRQLLAYSRRQILEMSEVHINGLLREFQPLLERTIRENIQIQLNLADDVTGISADANQIEQIIMNLAVNAQDALPNGGHITIETQVVILDETGDIELSDCKPGKYIKISFSDDGVGMAPSTLESVFEPFFSTKGEMGTGLGLSTVYGIVKQHNGSIHATSEENRGTQFDIYLPATDTQQPADKKTNTLSSPGGGAETILIVEDDPRIRVFVKKALQRQGYNTLIAANGEDALALLREHKAPLHLMLSDVIMPDCNGPALYETALLSHPELKAVYMSGYTDNVVAKHGIIHDDICFIQKPFTTSHLSQKIRSVLDS